MKKGIHVFPKGINSKVKCKQLYPRFEVGLICPFRNMITITPHTNKKKRRHYRSYSALGKFLWHSIKCGGQQNCNFKLKPCYYIHFQISTLGKGMNSLIPRRGWSSWCNGKSDGLRNCSK